VQIDEPFYPDDQLSERMTGCNGAGAVCTASVALRHS